MTREDVCRVRVEFGQTTMAGTDVDKHPDSAVFCRYLGHECHLNTRGRELWMCLCGESCSSKSQVAMREKPTHSYLSILNLVWKLTAARRDISSSSMQLSTRRRHATGLKRQRLATKALDSWSTSVEMTDVCAVLQRCFVFCSWTGLRELLA